MLIFRGVFGLLTSLIPFAFLFSSLPLSAASALAAWSLTSEGVLELRTQQGAQLKAAFLSATNGKGDRLWIDFPGELIRPRSIQGNGPIAEIRLGKPSAGTTRLVIELNPTISLDPDDLQLIGISPDRWQLKLIGLPTADLKQIGEGILERHIPNLITGKNNNADTYTSFDISDLSNVERNKYLVVIDPGHGGPDVGAVGIGGLQETDVVLDISLKVADLLRAKGVKVVLTRTTDIDLDLYPRVELANRIDADIFVSIHANASRGKKSEVNGIETFYYTGYRGMQLSTYIQNELLRVSSKLIDRGVRRAGFYVIRRTSMPAALVETGFVTGELDSEMLSMQEHRSRIAFAISNGILIYLQGSN